jgi:hypothetical protein
MLLNVLLAALAPAAEPPKLTTLSDPSLRYRVAKKPYVVLKRGGIEAVIVDNQAVDDALLPKHRAGYSGMAALRGAGRKDNLFVPAYAGLNFEHIHDGTVQPTKVLFEPRHAPMQLRLIDEHTAELYQAPTPHYALESCQRYRLLDDGTIELTFECVPRKKTFRNGYVGLFWASYINKPPSSAIHFKGHAADEKAGKARWIEAVSPRHGVAATHRAAGDERDFEHDRAFPLSLVFNLSKWRYREPWYYGRHGDVAFAQMFRPGDRIRFSQSPSGGGAGNPAWDFQLFIPDYQVGHCYQMVMRARLLKFTGAEQLEKDLGRHRRELALGAGLERVLVSTDKKGFVLAKSRGRFVPWGFNYDHDRKGRLIEDYWESEWPAVEKHFAQMRALGANVVRVHLQLGKFMDAADKPNDKALKRLDRLLKLAEKERLYLDLTGLGCYHKKDVPGWYDRLSEEERWRVQARFWRVVARRCARSPAVFCHDLMNEPIVPGGKRKPGDWLGPAFAGKHFVQFITLDQKGRARPDIARAWIATLVKEVRKADPGRLVTVGLVDWSLDRPGLTSGFVPEKVAPELDFLSVHLYPEKAKVDEALKKLAGFAVGKPVLIEETFPLRCSAAELEKFLDGSRKSAHGWLGFYWGTPPEELKRSKTIGDALTLAWLELFQRKGKDMAR